MDSLGNPQNNRIPYIDATSKDCTQGICSLYCPQWCYPAFPPPPPPIQFLGGDDTFSSGPNFSPLLIAIIGVLAGAFLIVTYYTVISKFCRRSSDPYGTESARGVNPSADGDPSPGTDHEPWYVSTGGLDEALIRSIAVCKYKRGSGMIEGTCSVCLSEFQDGESVRLLPNCTHAFHIICIDTWLTSHSNCPLCRSEVAPTGSFPVLIPLPYDVQLPGNESCRESDNRIDPGTASANPRTSSSDVPPQGEATGNGNLAVKSQSVRISRDACTIGRADTVIEVQHEELQPIRRSFSTGHLCRAVADTLKADQINEEDQIQDSTGSSTNHDAGSVKNYSRAKLGTGGAFSTV